MIRGISGASVPTSLPYADAVNAACGTDFWPLVAYAIFWRETIYGETQKWWNAATVISPDGGHGLGQLTASYPDNWQDPQTNARYAVEQFLIPARNSWLAKDATLEGDALIRLVAATYNAGFYGALRGHEQGNCDAYTTDNYAAAVVQFYNNLVTTGKP